jgi:filamentous hemagglutinin
LLLEEHFDAHGPEFGATDEDDYKQIAAAFLSSNVPPQALECVRLADKASIRNNWVTQAFGILSAENYIQTYFKPDPAWHGKSTNRAYFEWECKRKW